MSTSSFTEAPWGLRCIKNHSVFVWVFYTCQKRGKQCISKSSGGLRGPKMTKSNFFLYFMRYFFWLLPSQKWLQIFIFLRSSALVIDGGKLNFKYWYSLLSGYLWKCQKWRLHGWLHCYQPTKHSHPGCF